jgi:hypothetical protein
MSRVVASLGRGSARERDGRGGKPARGRVVSSLLGLTPLFFGVPVALGIVICVIRLLGTRYPDLGASTVVNSDAEQLYLGHTLYQNPANGYTGTIYTPLLAGVTSLLYHIYLWNGWPLLVVIGAGVALATLAARIAYLPAGRRGRVVRLLGAAGVGGIAYWLQTTVPGRITDANTDQVAWAFALFGLVAVADFGREPSRRRVVLAALLLSGGFWAKQTAIGVAALALAWVLALAATSMLSRKAAQLFTAVLVGVNVALLVVLNLLTNGWEFYINFEESTQKPLAPFETSYAILGLLCCALAVVFVGLVWLASGARAATRWRRSSARSHVRALADSLRRLIAADDPTGRRALLLGLYAVFGFVLVMYFLRAEGAGTNHFDGVVWALGLLGAAGWRVAQRHASAAAAAGGCVALYFALLQLGPVREIVEKPRAVIASFDRGGGGINIMIPPLENAVQWPQIPSELRSWAKDHTLWLPIYSDLNVPSGDPLYPDYLNITDKLASGQQPMFLVRALLERRFDAVAPFPYVKFVDEYASGFGKYEENYIWKLNEVIAAEYTKEPGLPMPPAYSPSPPYATNAGEPATAALLGRRPGPDRAAWMSHCFGPFAADGASFWIHRGGGFWCSFQPGHLQLVRAPTPLSEVVTTQPVRLAGTIAVSLDALASSQVNLVLEDGHATWMAQVTVPPGNSRDLAVFTSLGGASLGSTLVKAVDLPGGRREVRLSVLPTTAAVPAPPVSGGTGEATLIAPATKLPFALVATNGAAIDLNATHLEQ